MEATYETKRDELIAAIDALERDEPECTCEQLEADQMDASHCLLHNMASPWHRDIADLAQQLSDVQADIAYQASGEWAWDNEEENN